MLIIKADHLAHLDHLDHLYHPDHMDHPGHLDHLDQLDHQDHLHHLHHLHQLHTWTTLTTPTTWTTLTNGTTLTNLTDQRFIKKIIAEFALFTWSIIAVYCVDLIQAESLAANCNGECGLVKCLLKSQRNELMQQTALSRGEFLGHREKNF